jgi:hypothetical protein
VFLFNFRRGLQILVDDTLLEKQKKILEWLSPGSFSGRHEGLRRVRAENSGKWFFDTAEFKKWFKGKGPNCLICAGGRKLLCIISDHTVGTGKSVLMHVPHDFQADITGRSQ